MDITSDSQLHEIFINLVKKKGMFSHQKEAFDQMITNDFPQMVKNLSFFIIKRPHNDDVNKYDFIRADFIIENVDVTQACVSDLLTEAIITTTPAETMNNLKTYSSKVNARIKTIISALKRNDDEIYKENYAHLTTDIDIKRFNMNHFNIETNKEEIEDVTLFDIPVNVGSNKCNKSRMSFKELLERGEDPYDIPGYNIINGNEYISGPIIMPTGNMLKLFSVKKPAGMANKAEYSQKSINYDKTNLFNIYIGKDNNLYITSTSTKEVAIPLFLYLKIIGCPLSRDTIKEKLIQDNDETSKVHSFVTSLFNIYYIYDNKTRYDIAIDKYSNDFVSAYDYIQKDKMTKQEIIAFMSKTLNDEFAEQTFFKMNDESDSFNKKFAFLLYSTSQLIKSHGSSIMLTSRDSPCSKRYYPPAKEYLKTLRNILTGELFIKTIRLELNSKLISTSLENVSLKNFYRSKNAAITKIITEILKQTINTRGKFSYKKVATIYNYCEYNQLLRKNELNTIAQCNTAHAFNISQNSSTIPNESKMPSAANIGTICPASTSPDSSNVGLNKSLTIGASITNDIDDYQTLEYLDSFKSLHETKELTDDKTSEDILIFLDGKPLFFINVSSVNDFMNDFKARRRNNSIHKLASFCYKYKENELYIWHDAGRVYRPVVVVDSKTNDILLTKEDMNRDVNLLISEGKIEYLTSCEACTTSMVAPSYHYFLKERKDKKFDYIEFVNNIYSLSFSSVFNNKDQTTRNVYSFVQNKQAITTNLINSHSRFDKDVPYALHASYPFTLSTSNRLLRETNGYMICYAISLYTGNNQEDSTIIREGILSSREMTYIKSNTTKIVKDKNDEIDFDESKTRSLKINPDVIKDIATETTDRWIKGVIKPGTIITEKSKKAAVSIINLTESKEQAGTNFKNKEKEQKFIYASSHYETTCIDAVRKTVNTPDTTIQIKEVKLRDPLIGDKITNRHGQKNIISGILPDSLCPFDKYGHKPDVIWNIAGFPSRLTYGQIEEGVINNILIQYLAYCDCSTFLKIPNQIYDKNDMTREDYVEEFTRKYNYIDDKKKLDYLINNTVNLIMFIRSELKKSNYGLVELYNPLTGEKLEGETTMFYIYMQRLSKDGVDAVHAASEATRSILTRQPGDGAKSDGGIRYGYMEWHVSFIHNLIKVSSTMTKQYSDGITINVCGGCGDEIVIDYNNKNGYKDGASCDNCGSRVIPFTKVSTFNCEKFRGFIRSGLIELKRNYKPHISIRHLDNESDIDKFMKSTIKI
jgi:DNA-directed RNA polymerase beta subunit/DNA-directed RNA polymerase subunit RPC12/RpoP